MQEVAASNVEPFFQTDKSDPFLNVNFDEMNQTVPAAGASAPLTPDQRIALAGGDLDQAIAMGNRRA